MQVFPLQVIPDPPLGRWFPRRLSGWRATFNLRRGEIVCTRGWIKVRRKLKDTWSLQLQEVGQEKAYARTLGRVAVTGIASSLLKKGAGLGGALLDASLRGFDKNTLYAGTIVFRDLSIVSFVGNAHEIDALVRAVPERALTEKWISSANELIDRAVRLAQDGKRGIAELDLDISQNWRLQAEAENAATAGAQYSDRDAARERFKYVSAELMLMESLRHAATFLLEASAHEPEIDPRRRGNDAPRAQIQPVGCLSRILGAFVGLLFAVIAGMAINFIARLLPDVDRELVLVLTMLCAIGGPVVGFLYPPQHLWRR